MAALTGFGALADLDFEHIGGVEQINVDAEAAGSDLLAAMGATLGLCYVMEALLGPAGVFPSLLGGLLLGREAKRLARYLSEKYFKDDEESDT